MPRGIFVAYRNFLEGRHGGVQLCTKEYVDVIKASGIELDFCTFESDRRLSTRLLRQLNSSPYFRPAEPSLIGRFAHLAEKVRPDYVFLNQVSLAVYASAFRRMVPRSCKIVVLSHGLESTDLLHLIRLRDKLPLSGRIRPARDVALGKILLDESALRADIDFVCALSPLDVVLEQWIGAKYVGWLPRLVNSAPLEWRPSGDRLGFIGTLDHAPNLEGLVMVLDRLAAGGSDRLRIRAVGGPERVGRWLAQTYPFVDYLGALDDRAVEREAASWNAVLHPIFCFPRGCSTKLATAIAWHIPVVTTTMGHRGYEWQDGGFVIADTPEQFVIASLRLLNGEAASAARQKVIAISRTSPKLEDNARRLSALLNLQN